MRKGSILHRLRKKARALKREVYALYLAVRDPHTPWYAKALGVAVVGYALSPLDLIPDFIPFLGLIDDLILVPAGIALAIRLIPAEVMKRSRARAWRELAGKRKMVSRTAAVVVVLIWLILLALIAWAILSRILS
jgi:uncharacterized membrane protein YkvA (DUF1232 family)